MSYMIPQLEWGLQKDGRNISHLKRYIFFSLTNCIWEILEWGLESVLMDLKGHSETLFLWNYYHGQNLCGSPDRSLNSIGFTVFLKRIMCILSVLLVICFSIFYLFSYPLFPSHSVCVCVCWDLKLEEKLPIPLSFEPCLRGQVNSNHELEGASPE